MSEGETGMEFRRSMLAGQEDRLFCVPSRPVASVTRPSLVSAVAAVRAASGGVPLVEELLRDDAGAELLDRCRRVRTPFGAALAHEVRSGRRLCVFGDYDVDGMASTSAMVLALSRARRALGEGGSFEREGFAERALSRGVAFMVPERIQGYGLSVPAVESMRMQGAETIVCCDNGANAVAALARAQALGMAVLVVDHHPLADASAAFWRAGGARRMMCNPMFEGPLPDALADLGLPRDMCAAMVVDLVVAELFDRLGIADEEQYGAMLAGLATVTDVMPMIGQNRAAVRRSLARLLGGDGLPGVDLMLHRHLVSQGVLLEGEGVGAAGLRGAIDADFFGFVMGPRLNACGRTGQAGLGTGLILATGDRSYDLAQQVERLNDQRKEMEASTMRAVAPLVASASAMPSVLSAMVRDEEPGFLNLVCEEHDGSYGFFVPGVVALVVSPRCESGIAGLAASKVSAALGVPALVMSMRQTAEGFSCTGSGRVPPKCPATMVSVGAVASRVSGAMGGRGGGHSVAFGIHLTVPLEPAALVARLGALASMMADGIAADLRGLGPEVVDAVFTLTPDPMTRAEAICDLSVSERDLGEELVTAIEDIGPFGRSFPQPLVHIDAGPCSIRQMGKNGAFMVSLNGTGGRRRVAVKGFAKDFAGGLSGEAMATVESRLPKEGCGLIGRVKTSFFGRSNAVAQRRSWDGPATEVILEAVVERRPVAV